MQHSNNIEFNEWERMATYKHYEPNAVLHVKICQHSILIDCVKCVVFASPFTEYLARAILQLCNTYLQRRGTHHLHNTVHRKALKQQLGTKQESDAIF